MRTELAKQLPELEYRLHSALNRHIFDSRDRIGVLEKELGAAKMRLSRCEAADAAAARAGRTIGTANAFSCHGADNSFKQLEERITWLERSTDSLKEGLPLHAAQQLQKLRSQLLEEGAERSELVLQRARAEYEELRCRVDELDRWMREVVAPELISCRMGLKTERQLRDQAFAKFTGTHPLGGSGFAGGSRTQVGSEGRNTPMCDRYDPVDEALLSIAGRYPGRAAG